LFQSYQSTDEEHDRNSPGDFQARHNGEKFTFGIMKGKPNRSPDLDELSVLISEAPETDKKRDSGNISRSNPSLSTCPPPRCALLLGFPLGEIAFLVRLVKTSRSRYSLETQRDSFIHSLKL